ncbi:MAG: helix-turn-helix domain-containing protein [Treponemataceae bacterium]|nr:helix-turn-helix domain-containing protein [Treponemataceae bacterium]
MESTEMNELTEEPMDVKEAAAFLRCAVSTIYRDTALGCIPCIRKGKRLLFLKSDLLSWLRGMREFPPCPVVMK